MADNVTPIGGKKPRTRKPKVPEGTVVVPPDPGAAEHELRLQGKSWPQIAKALHHPSPVAAQQMRERYLQRLQLALSQERRLEALNLEIERLDTVQASYWDLAITGPEPPEGLPRMPDVRAAEVVLKVIAQRTKLLGLDDPDQGNQSPRTVLVTGSTDQYVASLKALIASESVVEAEVVDEDD